MGNRRSRMRQHHAPSLTDDKIQEICKKFCETGKIDPEHVKRIPQGSTRVAMMRLVYQVCGSAEGVCLSGRDAPRDTPYDKATLQKIEEYIIDYMGDEK